MGFDLNRLKQFLWLDMYMSTLWIHMCMYLHFYSVDNSRLIRRRGTLEYPNQSRVSYHILDLLQSFLFFFLTSKLDFIMFYSLCGAYARTRQRILNIGSHCPASQRATCSQNSWNACGNKTDSSIYCLIYLSPVSTLLYIYISMRNIIYVVL